LERINLITAVNQSGIIGTVDGQIPWEHSEDLKHFAKTTAGCNMIAGITTFRGMMGKLKLKDRSFMVLSSKFSGDSFHFNSIESLMEEVRRIDNPSWVIGGAKTYESFLRADLIDRILLTLVPTPWPKHGVKFPFIRTFGDYWPMILDKKGPVHIDFERERTIINKGLLVYQFRRVDFGVH